MESKENIELKDIIDLKALQGLMDDFYSLTNFGICIMDLNGNHLVSTGWQDICAKFHRVNSETEKNCIDSDTALTENVKKGEFFDYKCKNNLRHIVTPIIVDEQHVANMFLRQFMYEDEIPKYEIFLDQAARYGFDQQEYLSALGHVPRWNRAKVQNVSGFYSKFAQIISNLLTNSMALKRSLMEKEKLLNDMKSSKN